MRTSILGIHDFGDIDAVIANTKEACQVTHADPRCIASCVAVTTAVALMLQGKHSKESGNYDIEAVIRDAYNYARDTLETAPEVMIIITCNTIRFQIEEDPRSYLRNLNSRCEKAKKSSGLNGIRTYGLCCRCSALPTELSSQPGAGHIVSS